MKGDIITTRRALFPSELSCAKIVSKEKANNPPITLDISKLAENRI